MLLTIDPSFTCRLLMYSFRSFIIYTLTFQSWQPSREIHEQTVPRAGAAAAARHRGGGGGGGGGGDGGLPQAPRAARAPRQPRAARQARQAVLSAAHSTWLSVYTANCVILVVE